MSQDSVLSSGSRTAPEVDLRPIFRHVNLAASELVSLAEEPDEELDSQKLKKSRVQAHAKHLISLFAELEDTKAKLAPVRSAADVDLEIKALEDELKEKKALIRKVRSKMDGWSKRLREGEEGV
jgi:hypothetical protein